MESPVLRIPVLLALLLGGPALPAKAQDDGDACEGWLPDLRCERLQRPNEFEPVGTFPYLFEDPFVTTELAAWGIWHEFPGRSIFRGGDARVAALQIRLALTDRLGLIATKDGYFQLRPDSSLLDDESGWGDLMAGLKYALIRDTEAGIFVTPSLRYEATQGSHNVLQGNGEGGWLPATSFAWDTGRVKLQGGVGAYLPVDGDAESTYAFYNLHAAVPICNRLTPFAALNGITYIDDGDGSGTIKLSDGSRLSLSTVESVLGLGYTEGADIANLGSDDVEGHDYLTWAVGMGAKLGKHVWMGLAYERPFSSNRHWITQQRVALQVVVSPGIVARRERKR